MAEFSKEYFLFQGEELEADFSIIEIYNSLNEGDFYPIICEGFGITAIGKKDGECMVRLNDKWIEFASLE